MKCVPSWCQKFFAYTFSIIKKVVCEYISMFWALINLTQMVVP